MKTLITPWLVAICALALTGCSTGSFTPDPDRASRPVRLQMTVEVPSAIGSLLEDDIAEAFAYRVSSGLHEQGFKGRIKYLDRGEPISNERPLLVVRLLQWRTSRLGNVDCSFAASLKVGGTTKNLGVFIGSSMMMWPSRDIFARADDFDDAAQSALTDLANKIEQSGLLPKAEPASAAR